MDRCTHTWMLDIHVQQDDFECSNCSRHFHHSEAKAHMRRCVQAQSSSRPKDGAARFVRLPCSAFDSSLPSHRSICDAHIYAEVAVMRPIRLRMSHIQFGTTRMHASRHMHGVCSKASRS